MSNAPTTHVGIAQPKKLLTKSATELKPGRFLLYVTAATLLLVGLFGAAIYVPSASITLVAQAAPFTQKDVEIPASPGKGSIHVRSVSITRSNSQGFKTTGSIVVPLAPATGQVIYEWEFDSGRVQRSGSVQSVLGLPERDISGGITQWKSRLHPEEYDRVMGEIDTAIVLGQAAQSQGRLEVVGQYKTGEEYGGILARGTKNLGLVDQYITKMKNDGTLQNLIDQYLVPVFKGDPTAIPYLKA